MSSVNLNGALSSGFFQNLSATDDQPLTPAELAASDAASAYNSATTTGSVAQPHHHGALFQKIQQSVLSALESAGTSGSSDPNSIIQSAILNAINGGTGSDSDGDSDGSSPTTGADSPDSPTAFFQALQQYGISQDQFAQDLKAAFQQANGGQNSQDLTGLLVNTTG